MIGVLGFSKERDPIYIYISLADMIKVRQVPKSAGCVDKLENQEIQWFSSHRNASRL